MNEWKTIDSAPRDGSVFCALIDRLPYLCRYDEDGRFIRYTHNNIATGASYLVHYIDGKRLLEQTKEAEYDYQVEGSLWKLGFKHEPTHWQEWQPPKQD